jgi:dimethylargininase
MILDRKQNMLIAITREISPAFNRCELTHLDRQPIDLDLARAQHQQYEAALHELGCDVHSLPAEPDLPDSVFVEDVAIVVDEVAIITRPGAVSRRPEAESIARALSRYRQLCYIEAPGTVDGGDVLRVGKALYVGLSSRSNQAAIDQLRDYLAPYSCTVKGVAVTGCLHLKSAVTQLDDATLLINPAWVDRTEFAGMEFIEVDETEPHAANALMIGSTIIYPSSLPKTQKRLEEHGLRLKILDATEVAKAEGAVTCCSLIFRGPIS